MDIIWQELSAGIPDWQEFIHALIRLTAAALLGAVIGYERERAGKAAGLRTHILVALGTCGFLVACHGAGMKEDALSRVIQGVVTGIGFLGAGTILKLNNDREIKGLTTSAGIWMTAAIGVATGLGTLGLALLATLIAVIVLAVLRKVEITGKPGEIILPDDDSR
jgi:putative Mg2+ transporter-C (MgtC) family protein